MNKIRNKIRNTCKCDKCHREIKLNKEPKYRIVTYQISSSRKKTLEEWNVCYRCYTAMRNMLDDCLRHKKTAWIYNGTTQTLRNCDDQMNTIKLTNRQCKLVEVLANGYINDWYDIEEYVFGYHDRYTRKTLYVDKRKLLNTVDLNIRVGKEHGLKLDDVIFIE